MPIEAKLRFTRGESHPALYAEPLEDGLRGDAMPGRRVGIDGCGRRLGITARPRRMPREGNDVVRDRIDRNRFSRDFTTCRPPSQGLFNARNVDRPRLPRVMEDENRRGDGAHLNAMHAAGGGESLLDRLAQAFRAMKRADANAQAAGHRVVHDCQRCRAPLLVMRSHFASRAADALEELARLENASGEHWMAVGVHWLRAAAIDVQYGFDSGHGARTAFARDQT